MANFTEDRSKFAPRIYTVWTSDEDDVEPADIAEQDRFTNNDLEERFYLWEIMNHVNAGNPIDPETGADLHYVGVYDTDAKQLEYHVDKGGGYVANEVIQLDE